MDSPQHSRDKAAVKTVGFSGRIDAEEGQGVFVMATVFWNARSIVHIDYLQKGRTINGEYYANLLDRFNEDLKKNDRIWPRKKFFSTKSM